MSGAGQGEYYLRLAADRYYNRDSEPPGQWLGRGAAALGLSGEVESSAFRHLLLGRSPDGKRDLVQNAGKMSRTPGLDGTLSAIKEFSILCGVLPLDSDQRRQLLEAYERVVLETARWIEDQAGVTRRGRAGERQEPMGLVIAAFRHSTSRSLDPAIHTHLIILNVGVRDDGTTGALHTRRLFEIKMEAGRQFRRLLHKELKSLGLRAELKAGDRLVLHDIPQSLVSVMSKRSATIKRVMAERGWHSAEAAKMVTLATRPKKQEVRMEDLHKAWVATARDHGFTLERALSLFADRREQEREAAQERGAKSAVNTASIPVNDSVATTPATPAPPARGQESVRRNWWRTLHNSIQQARRLFALPRLGRHLRIERHYLFPKAPAWSPVRKWALPRLVWGAREKSTPLKPSPWRYRVLTTRSLGPLDIQVRQRRLFPKAPEWSPVRHLQAPSLALRRRTDAVPLREFPRLPPGEQSPSRFKPSRPFGLGL
jgi:conjugative relaxase-like TrwC/TraI family protein